MTLLRQNRKQTQVALLHQGLHIINPDPRLHSAAETAYKRKTKNREKTGENRLYKVEWGETKVKHTYSSVLAMCLLWSWLNCRLLTPLC